jgi:hypothetical protein
MKRKLLGTFHVILALSGCKCGPMPGRGVVDINPAPYKQESVEQVIDIVWAELETEYPTVRGAVQEWGYRVQFGWDKTGGPHGWTSEYGGVLVPPINNCVGTTALPHELLHVVQQALGIDGPESSPRHPKALFNRESALRIKIGQQLKCTIVEQYHE